MGERNHVRVEVASGDGLDVRSFVVRQRMSELFRIEIVAMSANLSVAFDEVIGKDASFSLETTTGVVSIDGVALEMEQLRVDKEGLATYALVIVPRAWLLTQRKNYRIFQYKSELEIVQQLLGEWGVEQSARIRRTHTPRKYRVQYDESDFTFACRMLEDAGISFYFELSEGGTTMVLDDEPQARDVQHPFVPFHDQLQVTPGSFVTKVAVLQAVKPGRMTIGDIDYRKPSTSQPRLSAGGGLAQEASLEQFEHEPGAFLYQGEPGGSTPTADDRGTARTNTAIGQVKTQNRLLGKRRGEKVVSFESNLLDLAPGSILSISGHAHRGAGGALLVTASRLEGKHDSAWRAIVESAPASVPLRPEPITPKPRVPGLESATVVGPKGEEIHTDEYGRVRVHFHWDRESQRNEESTCWIPVGQPWAGASFGGVNLPRIGQEVLVEFLGGDPDRPMVIGRVYTETNPPPDKLPRYKTVSGLMSESSPRMVMGAADGGTANVMDSPLGGGTPLSPGEVNGLVTSPGTYQAASPTGIMNNWHGSGVKFEDELNKEIFYLQAEKDMNILVNNCWRTIVGGTRATMIGTDDQLDVWNQHDTTIRRDQTLDVVGNQRLWVTENRAEYIQDKLELSVGPGGLSITSELESDIQAKRTITIEAKNRIELVVQGSKIEITKDAILVKSGNYVQLQPKKGGFPR